MYGHAAYGVYQILSRKVKLIYAFIESLFCFIDKKIDKKYEPFLKDKIV